MVDLVYRSDITVTIRKQVGTDLDICESAWVSSGLDLTEEQTTEKRQTGLIRSLMRQKHGSPFEEGFLSVRIEAPRAVRDEHVRHRSGSYSSSSLRYAHQAREYYIPPPERGLERGPDFKKMAPVLIPYDQERYEQYVMHSKSIYRVLDTSIQAMIGLGYNETEAIRWFQPDGLYMPYIARFNPRNLMHFLSLRTFDQEANHISYPMWEIEQVGLQLENIFAEAWPITYEAWVDYGREAP